MGSGVRRERRGKPDGSLRGPGRVFPQSYGLDRVAHRRGVTGGIRGSSPLFIPLPAGMRSFTRRRSEILSCRIADRPALGGLTWWVKYPCHAARPPRRHTAHHSAGNAAGLARVCFPVCVVHCAPAPGRSALPPFSQGRLAGRCLAAWHPGGFRTRPYGPGPNPVRLPIPRRSRLECAGLPPCHCEGPTGPRQSASPVPRVPGSACTS